MDDIGLVETVLDLTCFDIMNRFGNVHGYSSGFRVRHQAFRSEHTAQTSYNAHHIRCSNNNVEIKPSLVLDLRDQLVSAYKVSACCLCFLSLCVLRKYKDAHLLTCSVRKYYRTTDLLVSVASVTSCSDVC